MNVFEHFGWKPGRAICYSGFRDGQRPGESYPSYDQIKEDLLLLENHWLYLRLYDVDEHAKRVLEVIQKEGFHFQVMLSAYVEAERNNFGCPWNGGTYPEATLEANEKRNDQKIQTLIDWANEYASIVNCLSVGNEACVDWTDHYVPEDRIVAFVRKVKAGAKQPVTFCENYVPWLNRLKSLAEVVDFISIHTYPVWEYKHIHEAIEYTRENFELVRSLHPKIPIAITEAGWATNSNGLGILQEHVNEENQAVYFLDLMEWAEKEALLVYYFEAFDERWKGSDDPDEPEKHWGLFHVDRSPKACAQNHLLLEPKYPFSNQNPVQQSFTK